MFLKLSPLSSYFNPATKVRSCLPTLRNSRFSQKLFSKPYTNSLTLTSDDEINEKLDVGDNLFIRYKIVGKGRSTVLCLPGLIGNTTTLSMFDQSNYVEVSINRLYIGNTVSLIVGAILVTFITS
jgi:hypothetical protein